MVFSLTIDLQAAM